MKKPYAAACDRNKEPILIALKEVLGKKSYHVLEIGSGTGQHAIYMAQHLPNLIWTISDIRIKHEGIRLWLEEVQLDNIQGPVIFEVGDDPFPEGEFDVLFTANTFHIMPYDKVQELIYLAGENLKVGSVFIVYGPFNQNGAYSAESNRSFDKTLQLQDPQMGIRDLENVTIDMHKSGWHLEVLKAMPANNHLVVYRKTR